MTKIKSIKVTNLKALGDFEGTFNGASAIITGKNDGGKTTFLRGIPDRIRFIRPSIIVKEHEHEGKGEMELTNGDKFIWEFNDKGKDKLTLETSNGIKVAVTKELGVRFFKPSFDIDKFVNSTPQEQTKALQKLIGVDFTEIDSRYKLAYEGRTNANKDVETERNKLNTYIPIPEKAEKVDTAELIKKKDTIRGTLNTQYQKNKAHNDGLRKAWDKKKDDVRTEVESFNLEQIGIADTALKCKEALDTLVKAGYKGKEALEFTHSLPKAKPSTTFEELMKKHEEPKYIAEMPDNKELTEIDNQLAEASTTNEKAAKYVGYLEQKDIYDKAVEKAEKAVQSVKDIEQERKDMIAKAKLPSGFNMTPEGITVDGFMLDKNQISTSRYYCAALRLGAMNIGEVKTLYFDASTLDKNTLGEIEKWAKENDLQLLIERPDFDGGDIRYTLIEETKN